MDCNMHQPIKVEKVNSNYNHLSGILLNVPSNNQTQILPGQIIQSVHGQQLFIHSTTQNENQLIQYGSQNNQQLQILQLSSIQPQLIQANGQTFIYQPIQVDNAQVIPQPQQPQPIFININGNIMQLGTTVTNDSPTVVTPSAITTTSEQGVFQPNSLMIIPNNTISIKQEAPSTSESPEEEPLYVNAKQYHRIMIRRQARAKLEAEGKIPMPRRKYMYESRHKHALNRIRGDGGRFHSGSLQSIKMSTIEIQQNQQYQNPIIKQCYSLAVNQTFDNI